MVDTTENATRAMTMRDFFKEENGEMVPVDDSVLVDFKDGDIVEGEVVRIDKEEVLVDIGYKSEGLVPSNELSIRKGADPHEIVELGQRLEALVMQKEDADGRLVLSAKRAAFEKAWNRIEESHSEQKTVEGPVIEVVKGGLIIDIGLRGFLPASLVDIRRVRNLESFMGQRLECKVIELNRSRNNVVLSRRAVLEEERKEERERILTSLEEGNIVQGTVSNLVDFGAFVDLEGIDGLIHISELSWNHVDHPSEVVEVGEEVEVKVLEVDRSRERISLGLKQTRKDPWQEIVEQVEIGGNIKGRITKLVSFGAFVEVAEGVEGLIHISELADHHVETPDEIVRSGDEIEARIIDVDAKRRRLSLSLRPKKEDRAESDGEQDEQVSENGTEQRSTEQRSSESRPESGGGERRPRREREDRGDRGGRDRQREDRGGGDRDRGSRTSDGGGLRTGAFDKLSDLDLGEDS